MRVELRQLVKTSVFVRHHLRKQPTAAHATELARSATPVVLPLLDLPNELLLIIAEQLEDPKYVFYLLLTNRRFAALLTPLLHRYAVQDQTSINALHWAAARGHHELARFLIQKRDFSVDFRNSTHLDWTALHWAMSRKDRLSYTPVLRVLLENGADVAAEDRSRNTVLHKAVRVRCKEALELLLKNGAGVVIDVQEADMGQSALHMAAEVDRVGVLWKPLVENGADMGLRDRNGATPLHTAVESGNEGMVRWLIGKGAPVNAQDDRGRTPLHRVAYLANDLGMVRLLLESGADVNIVAMDGKTPLCLAVDYLCKGIVRVLLQNGADVESGGPIEMLKEKVLWLKETRPKWRAVLLDRIWIKRYKDMIKLLEKYRVTNISFGAPGEILAA